MNLCGCGCGLYVKEGRRFIRFHNFKGENNPLKHPHNRQAMSEQNPMFKKEISAKATKHMKINNPMFILDSRRKMTESKLKQWQTPEYREKVIKAQREAKRTEKTKREMSERMIGKFGVESRSFGTRRDENYKKRQSDFLKGLWKKPEYRENMRIKMSELRKKAWQDPILRDKMIRALIYKAPNKAEQKLFQILNHFYPDEWSFVGDGKVILKGFCPDFININGKKILIELFGEYWHKGREKKDKQRIGAFSSLGYETLVIWEKELKDEKTLIEKISRGLSKHEIRSSQ